MPTSQGDNRPASAPKSHSERAAGSTIQCLHCNAEIELNESLVAPLIKSREQEFERLQNAIEEREASLQRRRDGLEAEVTSRLCAERGKVAEEEQRKARLAMGTELELKNRELEELADLLKSRDAKLAQAQHA